MILAGVSDFGSAFPLAADAGSQQPWSAGINQLTLRAELAERGALRYTPAGVPAVECLLAHRSLQTEAGIQRQIQLEIGALALAGMATQLAQIDPGAQLEVQGFLAPQRKSGKALRLHLTRIDII